MINRINRCMFLDDLGQDETVQVKCNHVLVVMLHVVIKFMYNFNQHHHQRHQNNLNVIVALVLEDSFLGSLSETNGKQIIFISINGKEDYIL